MPGRSKRSKAAGKREQTKKECTKCDNVETSANVLENECAHAIRTINDWEVVSGTLHQGDARFHCPGVQCTYISLWALVSMATKSPISWNTDDVDTCVIEGNARFLEHCFERQLQPQMLLAKELPPVIKRQGNIFRCNQLDGDIIVGTLSQLSVDSATNCLTETIDNALLKGLNASDSCLLICGGQTIAIARQENSFSVFDPHSRGKNGLLHHTGTAVLGLFSGLQSLIEFIKRLFLQSLRLKSSEQFELVPIRISVQSGNDDTKGGRSLNKLIDATPCKNLENHEPKSSVGIAEKDLSRDPKTHLAAICDHAIESYFADQKRRDIAHKERKGSENTADSFSNNYRKEYMKQYMQKRRETESFRRKSNTIAQTGMKKIRETDKGRLQNSERAVFGMQKLRNTTEGNEKNKKLAAEGMKKLRATPEGKRKSNERTFEGMERLLCTKEGRLKHNQMSKRSMQKMLSTEEGRLKHKQMSDKTIKKMLSTKEGKQKHNMRSAEGMKKALSTEEGRLKHNVRCAEARERKLSTEEGRRIHNLRSAKGMKHLRKRKGFLEREHAQRKKRKLGTSFSDTVEKFSEAICSCSYVCTACHQVWFKQSVKEVSSLKETISLDMALLQICITGYTSVDNREWICNTCLFNIRQGKIPKLSLMNGMKFPQRPPELNLNNLEERLIALRIPFMQIRTLNSGGQFSLKGAVVNVPAEIEPTIRALPRLPNESETIPVKLKRMKEFKHAVATENVRPFAVMAALRSLMNTSELYKEADISIDDDWTTQKEKLTEDSSSHLQESEDESDTFSEVDDDDTPLMTLLDTQSFDKNEVLSVAPGEGQRPISIFRDPHSEYLAFPTLFCGEKRLDNSERHTPVYYSDICKWELRCVDRRAALHIPNIFYKMKKLQTEQVCSKVHLAVRRCKTKGKSYTAGYILKDNMGESLVRLDEGYRIFRTIRNSPQYWENQKKEVFSMIRQLGLPTLFMSLSANDLHWSELLLTLGKLVDNTDYSESLKNNTLSWDTRSRLVQSDPVTCVRHFDHRVSQFIQTVLKSPQSPFGTLEDYFYRVEFQQRGSPHIHMLAWMSGSPKYGENDDEEVLEYIDQVASCSSDVPDEWTEFLDFQKHKHSRSCRKGGRPVCRFGIPFPPMKKTVVLKPYNGDERSVYEQYYKTIQNHLCQLEKDIPFDEFLKETGLSEDDYMKAVQTSIKAEKVFLKRKPVENRINPYMKDLLGVWKANHDIQYVLDAYACAMYIVSYINKSAKGMSTLMAEACKEARKGNTSLKESVRHIGNRFLNSVEVSAQEAAYLILQQSMSVKSRKCEFIATSPRCERTFLLKSKKELEALPGDSTEIEADNTVKRYARRDEALENYCLADFVSKVVSVSKVESKDKQLCEDRETTQELNDDIINEEENIDNINESFVATPNVRYSVTKSNVKIVLRTKPKIIRFVKYSQKVDTENYFREQLMLFHPWRNEEEDLMNGYSTYEEHFKAVSEKIYSTKKEYDANSELLNEVEIAAESQTKDNFDDVSPNIESVEAEDSITEPAPSTEYAFYRPETRDHSFYDLGADFGIATHIPNDDIEMIQNRLPEKEYFELSD